MSRAHIYAPQCVFKTVKPTFHAATIRTADGERARVRTGGIDGQQCNVRCPQGSCGMAPRGSLGSRACAEGYQGPTHTSAMAKAIQ